MGDVRVQVEKVSVRWVVAVTLTGAGFVILAVAADLWLDLDNIVPSVLLEFGMAFLLAAVLFFLERRFVDHVERIVHNLTVHDVHHDHTTDNVTLTQEHSLEVHDVYHDHTTDNVTLTSD